MASNTPDGLYLDDTETNEDQGRYESDDGLAEIISLLRKDSMDEDDNRKLNDMLVHACSDGRKDIVELFINHGVNLDISQKTVDRAWDSPLIIACGHTANDKIVQLLLDNGANVNVVTEDEETSLMYASRQGCVKSVSLLLQHGANVNAKDDIGDTALICACRAGQTKVVELLLQQCPEIDIDVSNHDEETSLLVSCEHEYEDIIKLLLQRGAYLECLGFGDETPLVVSSRYKYNSDIIGLLLRHGADAEAINSDGETALIVASSHGNKENVSCLLQHGVNINVRRKDGRTALLCACQSGFGNVVKILLHHGADFDARDGFGKSATMLAMNPEGDDCLRMLLDVNADLVGNDVDGNNVFSCALKCENGQLMKLLLDDGRVLSDGGLKSIYGIENNFDCSLESLLVTMDYGIFEWKWCPDNIFKDVSLSALHSEISPGNIKYKGMDVSPLVLSILKNDEEATKSFMKHIYYFPEDYMRVSTDENITTCIDNSKTLYELFHLPLSLETWCCLSVSEWISRAGPYQSRSKRVDSLPIPLVYRNILKFKSD